MKRFSACLFFLSFIILLSSFAHKKSNCILWQLPDRNLISDKNESQQMSYVFLMDNGKVAVIDGGVKEETPYLRGFLATLGNEVEAWFVTHPHYDHIGALNEIMKEPGGIKIKSIYHSEFPKDCYENVEPESKPLLEEFYVNLKKSGIKIINVTKPGIIIQIDKTKFKILSVTIDDPTQQDFYNNNCMVIKVWDPQKSFLFLGDIKDDSADRLLNSPYLKDLNCDYLQMAHHGQIGKFLDFYKHFRFKVCLWTAPLWLYNNDLGKGFNTAHYITVAARELMDELGIKEHYVSGRGLVKIK